MRVAINGFGRIGKLVFRAFLEKNLKGAELVAINELGSLDSSLHLMKFDSIHGKLPFEIKKTKDGLKYNNKEIKFFSEKDPKAPRYSALETPTVSWTLSIMLSIAPPPKERKGRSSENSRESERPNRYSNVCLVVSASR